MPTKREHRENAASDRANKLEWASYWLQHIADGRCTLKRLSVLIGAKDAQAMLADLLDLSEGPRARAPKELRP